MTVTEARQDARLRRYVLRRHRLAVAGGTLSIVAPAPRSTPVQQAAVQQAVHGGEPPYWAQIWPASVGLARWLCRRRDLHGLAAVDLGCGVGVAAAAAARAGARVLACDVDPEALHFARFNLQHNGGAASAEVRQLDWQQETLEGAFDLVLLADVTYRVAHHLPILRQIRNCLGHQGLVLHCDPHRQQATGFLGLTGRHWRQRCIDWTAHFDGERVPLRLCGMAADDGVLQRWFDQPHEVRG